MRDTKGTRLVLRCTVVDGSDAQDVEVEFSPESSVESLLASLPGELDGRPAFVGEELLTPDSSSGASPLTFGSFLTVGGRGRPREAIPDDAVGVLRVLAGADRGVWCWVRRAESPSLRTAAAEERRSARATRQTAADRPPSPVGKRRGVRGPACWKRDVRRCLPSHGHPHRCLVSA